MREASVGQLLINEVLPEEMRDYSRVLDKKSVHTLLQQVARKHPEQYREVSFRLSQIGQRAAQDQGGMSFGLRHLRRSRVANETRARIQHGLQEILSDDSLSDRERNERIMRVVHKESLPQQKAVLDEAIADDNPLGLQVLSGSRGKPMNLASLLAADMLYSDHRDEVIPIPVLRSYSEGLSPEEYWAGTYGARRGIIATKFATQEAGFLSKQLNQAGHRLVVMGEDGDEADPDAPVRGMVVDTGDMDNEGALLARDTGPYKKNTPLTPKILKQLDRMGLKRILIRSPLVGGSPEGGVYARDVGIRENGTLPGRGEQVGLQAAQALSEPISQGQLSAKHSGGVAGQEKAVGGFQYINQLIQVPKKMLGGAAHATVDGTVQRIEAAPAGGHYVTIDNERHYVGAGFELKVKKGDTVEAGDMLSDGIPNPAIITQHKGVGEGRRYFVNEFRKAMAASGMQGHRRNIELLARGLINHVQLTEETGDHVPDDIVPYSTFEHTYKPREGHERLEPQKAIGQYLERPVLHYTIGTKIRPSMLRDFAEFGVTSVPVHKNPPPFQPHMVRGMYQLQHDPDWMTQMYGSGLKKSLLESVARGGVSEERGTSFVPSLATGLDFGDVPNRAVVKPQQPYALPAVSVPDLPDTTSIVPDLQGKQAEAKGTGLQTVATGGSAKAMGSSPKSPSASVAAPQFKQQMQTLSVPTGPTRRLPSSQQPSVPHYQSPTQNIQQLTPNIMQSQPLSPAAPQATQPVVPPQITAGQPNVSDAGNLTDYPSDVPTQPGIEPGFGPSSVPDQNMDFNAGGVNSVDPLRQFDSEKLLTYGQSMIDAARTGNSPIANTISASPVGQYGRQLAETGTRVTQRVADAGRQAGNQITELAQRAAKFLRPAATEAATAATTAATTGASALPAATEAAGLGSKLLQAGGTGLRWLGRIATPLAAAVEGYGVYRDVSNKGWDQTTADNAQRLRDIVSLKDGWHTLYQAPMQVFNPVTNAQVIAGGVGEIAGGLKDMAGSLGTSLYDMASGTDAQGREAATDRAAVQATLTAKQQELQRQRDAAVTELANNQTFSPTMRAQRQQHADELQHQIAETQQMTDAANDETAGWQLGNQNWFGGGHRFRDAISGTVSNLDQQISQLQQTKNPSPAQSQQLAQAQQQKAEYVRLLDRYANEVGYSSTGAFDAIIRRNVQGKKQRIIAITQQLRSPEAADPQYRQRLEQERNGLEAGLTHYRNWAAQAEQ